MVVVPDTQSYVKKSCNQGVLELMFAWIAKNCEPLKIQQVLVTGDLVVQNRSLISYGQNNDQTGPEQWQAVSRAFERLDGVVPYVLSTGNHDYGLTSAQDRETSLAKYFPLGRNSKWTNVLKECGKNTFGQYTLENAAYEFITPNKQKVLVVSLGFSPTDEAVAWAKSVFNKSQYKDHFGILLTHSYLGSGESGVIKKRNYLLDRNGGNIGTDIHDKLVQEVPNIRLVVCGHISSPDNWRGCVGFRSTKNSSGKTVHEMLFDPQALGGGWAGNGGDGWIRLLEFSADMKQIKVRTFSPLFAISPSTRNLAWHTAHYNEFVMEYKD
jgi:hypothetical protein